MKNFVFRFPRTKKSKEIGWALLQAAIACIESASDSCRDEEGNYTAEGVKLLQQGCRLWNQGANRLGFRNLADMERYREIHGKI